MANPQKIDSNNINYYIDKLNSGKLKRMQKGAYTAFQNEKGEFAGSVWGNDKKTVVTIHEGKTTFQYITQNPKGTIDTKCEYHGREGNCIDKDGTTY